MVSTGKKTPPIEFKIDEHPRETSMDALAALPPVFKENGTVTAGNSSGRNDGAAFVLMMVKEKAIELGYTPMAKWLSGGDYGVDPKIMGIAPAHAIPQALKRAGLKLRIWKSWNATRHLRCRISQSSRNSRSRWARRSIWRNWNPNGGAIAFGHPNGASGARICLFAMKELIRRGGKYGFFSSCCGGGLGVATVIENLQC